MLYFLMIWNYAPFYRIVVADSRSPRDGRCIEEIGTYDPTKDPSEYHVDDNGDKGQSLAYREAVLRKHDVTSAEFDSSMVRDG